MSGKRVTDRQVRRYMDSRKDGHIQVAAAARAGFSERTGRRIDGSPVLPSQRDRTRRYRTRQDPFAEVWRAELVPMLTAMPSLRATTLLEELQRRHPARYPDRMLRSLQRRVAHWRATEGPERELIFCACGCRRIRPMFPRLLVMRSRESPCYQPRGAGITRCVVHPNFFDEIPEPVIFQPRLDRPDDARGVCVMGDDIALVESRHPCLLRVRLPQDSPDKLRHRREVR